MGPAVTASSCFSGDCVRIVVSLVGSVPETASVVSVKSSLGVEETGGKCCDLGLGLEVDVGFWSAFVVRAATVGVTDEECVTLSLGPQS